MNFYKHHLGDYDGATAHLDWLEDLAYRRLLGTCYRTEQPLPADLGATCRLVRASAPAQRKAVQVVLSEFFELRPDGWHNQRADEEITAYQAQATTNRRIAQSRSRGRINNEPLNEPLNASSTIGTPNHKPLTTNHKPVNQENTKTARKARVHVGPEELVSLGVDEQAAFDWLAVRKAKNGPLTQTAVDDLIREAGKAGISVAQAVLICARKNWRGFNASWDWRDAMPKKTAAEMLDESDAQRRAA